MTIDIFLSIAQRHLGGIRDDENGSYNRPVNCPQGQSFSIECFFSSNSEHLHIYFEPMDTHPQKNFI